MKNPIKINEVEQLFSGRALKDAIALIKKNEVELVEKAAGGKYRFMIKNSSVYVKSQAGTIVDYECSCGIKNCEHLCAVILSFQKEIIQNLVLTKRNAHRSLFKNLCRKVKQKIFLSPGVLKNMGEIKIELEALQKNKADEYFICLALLNELSAISTSLDEKSPVNRIINEVQLRFGQIASKNASSEQIDGLFQASINSLSSSRFNSGLFCFLIPYAALYIDSQYYLKELKNALERKRVRYHYPGSLDRRLIAFIHIENALAQNSNRKPNTEFHNTPEQFIANAEKLKCVNKPTAALKELRKGYEVLKENKPATFISYLEYVIEQARQINDSDTELFFIKEVLIHDFQINKTLLARVNSLLQGESRSAFYEGVVKQIKKSHRDVFDKLSVLLMQEAHYEELIRLISKQQNKFSLLNQVAMRLLPQMSEDLFKTYVAQFLSAAASASDQPAQQKIIKDAQVYLNRLPKDERDKLVEAVIAGLGGHSHFRSLILKHFPI